MKRATTSCFGAPAEISRSHRPRQKDRTLLHPTHDARDAVHGHLRAIRDASCRVSDAEHHRDPSLPRERREVRGAAAAFGDAARHAWQDVTQRRTRHTRYQHVACRNAPELAFAVDDNCAARAPADTSRMTVETRM